MTRRDVDERVRSLAVDQHGAFAWWQDEERGADKDLAARRVAARVWHQPAHGVYTLAGSAPTWRLGFKVAELSVVGSSLSGRSALQVHDVPGGTTATPPRLAVPANRSVRSKVAVIHRSSSAATMRVDGFRVATVEQAVFDVAGQASMEELGRIIDHSLLVRRASMARFQERMEVYGATRLAGIGELRTLLAEGGDGFVVARERVGTPPGAGVAACRGAGSRVPGESALEPPPTADASTRCPGRGGRSSRATAGRGTRACRTWSGIVAATRTRPPMATWSCGSRGGSSPTTCARPRPSYGRPARRGRPPLELPCTQSWNARVSARQTGGRRPIRPRGGRWRWPWPGRRPCVRASGAAGRPGARHRPARRRTAPPTCGTS